MTRNRVFGILGSLVFGISASLPWFECTAGTECFSAGRANRFAAFDIPALVLLRHTQSATWLRLGHLVVIVALVCLIASALAVPTRAWVLLVSSVAGLAVVVTYVALLTRELIDSGMGVIGTVVRPGVLVGIIGGGLALAGALGSFGEGRARRGRGPGRPTTAPRRAPTKPRPAKKAAPTRRAPASRLSWASLGPFTMAGTGAGNVLEPLHMVPAMAGLTGHRFMASNDEGQGSREQPDVGSPQEPGYAQPEDDAASTTPADAGSGDSHPGSPVAPGPGAPQGETGWAAPPPQEHSEWAPEAPDGHGGTQAQAPEDVAVAPVAQAPEAPPSPAPAYSPSGPPCPSCNRPTEATRYFCKFCGAKLK